MTPDSASLADPAGSDALVAAVAWLQGTLLGTVATTIAVVAIASVGLGMLTGRIELRRGATVIIGCFILFGASGIAAGLRSAASGAGITYAPVAPAFHAPPPLPAPAQLPRAAPPSNPYDPYAGASVP